MIKNTALPVRAKQTARKTNNCNNKSKTDVVVETTGDEVHLIFEGQRRYRIRGLEKNNSSQQLKVNILAARR